MRRGESELTGGEVEAAVKMVWQWAAGGVGWEAAGSCGSGGR
jgi:hypothetical protein